MTRRNFLQILAAATAAPIAVHAAKEGTMGAIGKPASYWKPLLPEASYKVLFEEDTERSHTSPLLEEHRPGTFICAACHQPLFDAGKKYESGTGWPSFWQPLPDAVATRSDRSLFFARTEYHCSRCGGHQGHVFDDGPAPTHQRYCNNGVALNFVAKGETLPALRG